MLPSAAPRALAIIPAKTDSKRLERKNLQTISNRTLIEHSVEYALACNYVGKIIVSSESLEVQALAQRMGVEFHHRPVDLCGETEVVDVYAAVARQQDEAWDLMVGLQPDHPDRDRALSSCIDYMVDNNYDDLIMVEPSFRRSGSVRIFRWDHLLAGHVSKRIGCLEDASTDIHYASDLERARQRFRDRRLPESA